MSVNITGFDKTYIKAFVEGFWFFKTDDVTNQYSIFQDFTSCGLGEKIIVITDDLLFCLSLSFLEKKGHILVAINNRKYRPEFCFISGSQYFVDVLKKLNLLSEDFGLEFESDDVDSYVTDFFEIIDGLVSTVNPSDLYEAVLDFMERDRAG